MQKRLWQNLVLAIVISLSTSAFAETITLKSGTKVEGKILERTDKYVKLDFHGVPIKYNIQDIENIDGNPPVAVVKNESIEPAVSSQIPLPEKIEPPKPQIPREINWQNNLDEAFSMAKRDARPLMVDFYTDWCGWCKKLDSDVYTDQTIRELSNQFICVKINADNNKQAAQQYNVRGYPTIIFLSPKGDVLKVCPGYVDANTLAGMMREAAAAPAQTDSDKLLKYMKTCPPSVGQALTGMRRKFSPIAFIVACIFSLAMYVYTSLCLMLISKKAGIGPAWLAWIPIGNIFLMFNIAGISYWIMLLLITVAFVPLVGLACWVIFSFYLSWQLAVSVNRSGWVGILMVVPLIGYIAMGYLAFSKRIDLYDPK